jgi:hypothetical protein
MRLVHVRPAGQDDVYEASGLTSYDVRADANAWVERSFVDVDFERIRGFTLVNEVGTVEVERGDGGWTVVLPADRGGTVLDQAAVDGFLRSAASMSLADPIGPLDGAAQGFEPPAATLTLNLEADESGETPEPVAVSIGAVDPDNDARRFATRSGFGFAVTVWSGTADPLLQRGLDDWTETEGDS